MIAFERELRERSTGLRTQMLTELAASMITVLTFDIFHEVRSINERLNADPIRLIEAVRTGVSLVAAGTIVHATGNAHGLTTGAGIWLAGALGVPTGAGYYLVALIGVLLALSIIMLLRSIEKRLLATKGKSV